MAHLSNISDLARNTRSEANLERLKIRNPSAAYAAKKYISSAEIVFLVMKDIIKKKEILVVDYDLPGAFKLGQAIQKLANNNQFFLQGGGGSLPTLKQLPAYITRKQAVEEEENMAHVEKINTRPDSESKRGREDIERWLTCSIDQKVTNRWLQLSKSRDYVEIYRQRKGRKVLGNSSNAHISIGGKYKVFEEYCNSDDIG
jgi:hypothetical protein